jgi:hypothetical protein
VADELVSVNLDTGDVMIDNVAVAALPRPSIWCFVGRLFA